MRCRVDHDCRRASRVKQVSGTAGGPHLLWRTGDRVRWRDRIGDFQSSLGDGEHAEIMISGRTWRVRLEDLA